MRRGLVIVGKAPEPGRSKTRLVPPLSAGDAAELSRAFLLDTCATALTLGWEQVSVVYAPGLGSAGVLHALLPPGVTLRPQRGHGLGEALAGAFADHLGAGLQQVVLIGSDTPDLPKGLLEQAGRALEESDGAIGPSADGGYYLLALRQQVPELFQAIAWSTDQVYAQTLARAGAVGVRLAVLPSWSDVDTPEDLARLRDRLRRAPSQVAPRTRQVLRGLGGLARTPGSDTLGTSSVGERPEARA